jgi:hypothetical protein
MRTIPSSADSGDIGTRSRLPNASQANERREAACWPERWIAATCGQLSLSQRGGQGVVGHDHTQHPGWHHNCLPVVVVEGSARRSGEVLASCSDLWFCFGFAGRPGS